MRLIMDEARHVGLPQPKIEELGLRFRLTIYLGSDGSLSGPGRRTPTGGVTRLVNALNGEKRRTELQEALEKGFLEMTVPEKPRSRRQRYRLTEKGETLARENARRYRKGGRR